MLIETNRPNVKLQVKSDAALQPATQEVRFKEAGLHVVEFRADSCLTDVKMEFSDGSRSESAAIEQIVNGLPKISIFLQEMKSISTSNILHTVISLNGIYRNV